jgi:hypothetical protein
VVSTPFENSLSRMPTAVAAMKASTSILFHDVLPEAAQLPEPARSMQECNGSQFKLMQLAARRKTETI